MKGKAIARQGFYDVYQEGDGEPLQRLQSTACIYRWRKQSASASALRARIARLLSQETTQVEVLILFGLCSRPPIVDISALLRQCRSRLFNDLRLAR
jgi:hypothetical protein